MFDKAYEIFFDPYSYGFLIHMEVEQRNHNADMEGFYPAYENAWQGFMERLLRKFTYVSVYYFACNLKSSSKNTWSMNPGSFCGGAYHSHQLQ